MTLPICYPPQCVNLHCTLPHYNGKDLQLHYEQLYVFPKMAKDKIEYYVYYRDAVCQVRIEKYDYWPNTNTIERLFLHALTDILPAVNQYHRLLAEARAPEEIKTTSGSIIKLPPCKTSAPISPKEKA